MKIDRFVTYILNMNFFNAMAINSNVEQVWDIKQYRCWCVSLIYRTSVIQVPVPFSVQHFRAFVEHMVMFRRPGCQSSWTISSCNYAIVL